MDFIEFPEGEEPEVQTSRQNAGESNATSVPASMTSAESRCSAFTIATAFQQANYHRICGDRL
jgi:hypothetical protein